MRRILFFGKTLVLALLFLLSSIAGFSQFKVVGYVPSWAGNVSDIPFARLTHVNYAFVLPTSTGGLQAVENPSKLQSLVSVAHANGVKVLIAVGGWNDGNDSAFESLAANATSRTNFVNSMLSFVNQYGLDGVDIDWEYPDAGGSSNNYSLLMQQLSNTMHANGKLLTAAVVAVNGGSIQSNVFGYVDFLNLMAYDGGGSNHSTYDFAVQSINYWKGRGLPAGKAILGVPFYGRSSSEYVAYNGLLSRGASPNSDSFNGIGYNGIPTIKSKTNLAFDQGGGIMIWELSQDVTNGNSLLLAIDQVVDERTGNPPAGCTGSFTAVPGTLQAEAFCQMSGIQTEATTDTGGGQNVGYIDAGDWMGYRINVPSAGTYTVRYRVASQAGGGSIRFERLGGSGVFGTISVPSTGAWQTWTTIQHNVQLAAGQQDVALVAVAGGFNINWFSVSSTTTSPAPPIGQTIWLRGGPNNQFVSGENGTVPMRCNRATVGTWEQFTVVDAAAGKIALRSMSKYVSSENGVASMTCSRTTISDWEKFDWIVNTDGKISLRGNNGLYVSSENGTNAMTCNRATIGGWEAFSFGTGAPAGVTGSSTGRMATTYTESVSSEEGISLFPYPNPVIDKFTYPLPQNTKGHSLKVFTEAGREMVSEDFGDTGVDNTINVSGWESGMYIIKVYTREFRNTFKILKK